METAKATSKKYELTALNLAMAHFQSEAFHECA
jgi:hypothetical protein